MEAKWVLFAGVRGNTGLKVPYPLPKSSGGRNSSLRGPTGEDLKNPVLRFVWKKNVVSLEESHTNSITIVHVDGMWSLHVLGS